MATQSSNGFPTEINWSETDLTVKSITTEDVTAANVVAETVTYPPTLNEVVEENRTVYWDRANYLRATTQTYRLDSNYIIENQTLTPGSSMTIAFSSSFTLEASSGDWSCFLVKEDDGTITDLGIGSTVNVALATTPASSCIGRNNIIRVTFLGSGVLVGATGDEPSYLIEKVFSGDITKP